MLCQWYTFKNFNNIYILQNYLSCHALKIKSTQIIFKQETHSKIFWTLAIIHKQTSLNFDGKKHIILYLAQTHSISITDTALHDNHPCQDTIKSSLYNQLYIIAYGYFILLEKTVVYIINRKYMGAWKYQIYFSYWTLEHDIYNDNYIVFLHYQACSLSRWWNMNWSQKVVDKLPFNPS